MDNFDPIRASGLDEILEREKAKAELFIDPKKYFGRTPEYYSKEKDLVVDFLKKFQADLIDELAIPRSKANSISKKVGKCITSAMKKAAASRTQPKIPNSKKKKQKSKK